MATRNVIDIENDVLTLDEVNDLLGELHDESRSDVTLRQWCIDGKLAGATRKGGKMRGIWLVPRQSVLDFEIPKRGQASWAKNQ